MKKSDKCVHYNGTVNECCDAGVNYRELAGPGDAWARRLPCIAKYAGPDPAACDKIWLPTVEELEAEEAAHRERFARMAKARAAIVESLGGPWKKGTPSASGTIECPNCRGQLRFSRAGYNGHVWAKCETPNCCSWVE